MTRTARAAVAALAVGAVGGAVGCHATGTGDRPSIDDRWGKFVDPSYPERYNYTARQEVLAPFAAQVNNAHVLDQTLFNYHFQPGTDELTPAGLQKVEYLVRRRPAPDPRVYLQTAHDLAYDPTAPEKYVTARTDLDLKRAQSVQRYLQVQTAARPVNFEVQVTDPDPNTIRAETIAGASRGLQSRYTSGIGGAGLQGTGGSTVSAPAPMGGGR